jgi:hypothetical protein
VNQAPELNTAQFENIAQECWNLVCDNIKVVLEQLKIYDVSKMLILPNPSLEKRIEYCEKVVQLMDIVERPIMDQFPNNTDLIRQLNLMADAKMELGNLKCLFMVLQRMNNSDKSDKTYDEMNAIEFNRLVEVLNRVHY